MKIELKEITVRDIADGYSDKSEEGVFAYNGKLSIRPPYQREFVYGDKQRVAVIDTIIKGFPLNVMYWAKNGENNFEVLDGQQRTISVCQFLTGVFTYNDMYFHSLPIDIQEKILDYKLFIYVCEGEESEKLQWFKTINIAGEKLTEQELRNAVYTGEWLSDAKKHFSKSTCPAKQLADGYVNKNPIRQELLETILKWISINEIDEYMSKHQHDSSCNELWLYFNNMMGWIKATFRDYYKEMKNVEWGFLFNAYHKRNDLNPTEISEKIKTLMADEEVQNKKGIFYYVLDENEKNLNLRTFRDSEKRTIYEKQQGICPICGKHFEYNEMEADHIVAWSKGGKSTIDNLQMLCKKCNIMKSNKI